MRIMVIGNGGGGKTTLAMALAQSLDLPYHEVDPIQFRPGWERTPVDDVRAALAEIHERSEWVVDGFGPWDSIEARATLADRIYFVDHPLWVHFWWAAERQIAAAKGEARLGGPPGCDLNDVTKLMFETIWRVDQEIRPQLVAMFEPMGEKVIRIASPEELQALLDSLGAPEGGEEARAPRVSRS